MVLFFALVACSAKVTAPTLDELKNAHYTGIDVGDLTLTDGRWQGPPYSVDSAVAPRAGIVEDFYYHADLDDDNTEEAIALIWSSAGGTGSNSYLAVMKKQDGKISNIATALIGDRVKIQSSNLEHGSMVLHVLQAGENDPMCCPTQLATRTWRLHNDQLIEGETEITGQHPTR
jgi:hypothetical protein